MTNNGNQPAQLTVTSVSEWNQGELTKLPSGKVVRIVSVDVLALFQSDDGDMPDIFMQYIIEPKQESETSAKENGQLFEALTSILPRFAMACIVEPQVTEEPTANSIGVNQIELGDKLYLFQRAMGGLVKQGSNFPTKPSGNVASLPDVSTVAHKSQRKGRSNG